MHADYLTAIIHSSNPTSLPWLLFPSGVAKANQLSLIPTSGFTPKALPDTTLYFWGLGTGTGRPNFELQLGDSSLWKVWYHIFSIPSQLVMMAWSAGYIRAWRVLPKVPHWVQLIAPPGKWTLVYCVPILHPVKWAGLRDQDKMKVERWTDWLHWSKNVKLREYNVSTKTGKR